MKNKKILIAGVILVVILVIAILGILYFTTDLFKSNQQLFYKYLSQTKILNEEFLKQYNIANNRIVKNSNSSTIDLSISSSIPNQETGIADVQNILNIKSNGLENVLTKQSYRDFTFSSNNQNLLTLKYMRDDNTYAIGADNILAKYLAVENSNLKELFSKLGVQDTSAIPDSIKINYEEILKIDEQIVTHLKETYGTLIYENISKDNFYKISNENDTEIIGLSLKEEEVINIIKVILETAKNDNVLLNLILNKAQLLNYNNVTIENIQSQIQNYIEDLTIENEYNEYTTIENNDYGEIKDTIYKVELVKKENSVIGINLETNYTELVNDYENTSVDGFSQIEQKNTNIIQIDFSENNKITICVKYNDSDLLKGIVNYSYDNNNITTYIELEIKEDDEINSLKFEYRINNFQTDNITQNYLLYTNFNNEQNYQINIDNNITLKQDVVISKLTTENSAKLNDMTSEELSSLFTAIMSRVTYLYEEQNNNF